MLTVTNNATSFLASMLEDAGAPDGAAARLTPAGNGIGLEVDQQREGDTTFEHEDRTVLLVQGELADMLNEHTLDAQETDEGKTLVLRKEGEEGEEGGN